MSVPVQAQSTRDIVISRFRKELHVKEPRNRNDHPRIKVYHKEVNNWLANLKPVPAYCGSGVHFMLNRSYISTPTDPQRARSWSLDKSKLVWSRLIGYVDRGDIPKKGDIGLTVNKSQWHVFMILDWMLGKPYCITIECNTSDRNELVGFDKSGTPKVKSKPTGKEGNYIKVRFKDEIFGVYNYID